MNNHGTASTFSKGLAVLACFQSGQGDLTMADIARRTGFDRAVVRRLCLTLVDDGYLQFVGKTLCLTPKVLMLAGGYLGAQRIGRTVQPVLNQFAEELNGEIALAVRSGKSAVYVARSAVGSSRLSLGLSIGSTLPLLPTAIGRMLLAQCDEATRKELIANCDLGPYTTQTQLDRAVIAEDIDQSAQQGFSCVLGEFEAGAAGLAVPIPAISGAEAVLATNAPSAHLVRQTQRDDILSVLFNAALCLRAG